MYVSHRKDRKRSKNVLRGLVEHEDRPIPGLPIDDLEVGRVAEDGPDAGNLGHGVGWDVCEDFCMPLAGTGKSACHLRSSANTGCVQVANLKIFSAVTCVQNNSLACSLMFVMLASACICEHFRTCQDTLFLTCVYPSTCSMCEEMKLSLLFNT